MTHIAMEKPRTKWWFVAGKIIYKWDINTMAMLNNQRVLTQNMQVSVKCSLKVGCRMKLGVLCLQLDLILDARQKLRKSYYVPHYIPRRSS